MRVINLDETGIKLINNKKNQIYLDTEEVRSFVAGQYTIKDGVLNFKNYTLSLSQQEIKDLDIVLKYLKSEILKESV